MSRRLFRIRDAEPLLDIVSYGRGSPQASGSRLTRAQMDHIRRTVQRVPEAVVKVLPRDSNDLNSAGAHLNYIGRYGKLALEADDGEQLQGKKIGKSLLEDWDVDIDDVRRQASLAATRGHRSPKLVHKLTFSMPPGTPAEKLLAAVRNFAREEFALQHRYAFVLHTDQHHPHVHLVLKAVSEQGVRLNIKKATLRSWRSEFARHLRQEGIAANATERAVRGENRAAMKDSIYRAALRGDSTYVLNQAEAVAAEILHGHHRTEAGKIKLDETRKAVEGGWHSLASLLARDGHHNLANDVRQFVAGMPATKTQRERLAEQLLEQARKQRTQAQQNVCQR
jgi:hypothetical protein